MRILITSGLSSSDVGGPAQYGPKLQKALEDMGHKVRLVSYGKAEKFLPIGLRHIYFFLRILPSCIWANGILTLDAWSVGVPSVLASRLLFKKVIVRVGGDYLWSAYVNRTSLPVTLPEFYRHLPDLDKKEEKILFFTGIIAKHAGFLAFNTDWQKKIWDEHYEIRDAGVVRNFIPEKGEANIPKVKNFLWAGRAIPEKNLSTLEKVAKRLEEKYSDFRFGIVTGESHDKVIEKIMNAYAVVSPALTDICPNFIIEAASFNKPFIMTKETGLGEIYPNGGIFFDPLNAEELERAIEAMFDYRVYNKAVEDLKLSDARHSWREMAEEYIDIWQKI